jgi:hypothetical protein
MTADPAARMTVTIASTCYHERGQAYATWCPLRVLIAIVDERRGDSRCA